MLEEEKEPRTNDVVPNDVEEEKEPRDAEVVSGEVKAALKKDIKYRGPLSYRGVRIIGWLCFAIGQLAIVFQLGGALGVAGMDNETAINVFSLLGNLMAPLFILANFSLIMRARASYKKLLIFYGGLTLAIIVGYYYAYLRFLRPILRLVASDPAEIPGMMTSLTNNYLVRGLNLFLDLFLCVLFGYFMLYRPKKVFVGRKLIIFRLFAVLVVAYEIVATMLRVCQSLGAIQMGWGAVPWLTSKPIVFFFSFVIITFGMKFREKWFLKHGGTSEQYDQFLATKRNSLHVSLFVMLVFIILGVIDAAAVIVPMSIIEANGGGSEGLFMAIFGLMTAGVGEGLGLVLISPVALLFSYTRDPFKKELDKLVPLLGIGMMLLVLFEGIFYIITHLG